MRTVNELRKIGAMREANMLETIISELEVWQNVELIAMSL